MRGIPIRAHITFLIMLVIYISPALGVPAEVRGRALVIATITSFLFFGSILLHELGHAFQALKEKLEIEGITLWMFGGLAHIRSPITSPWVDFRVAIAGPAVTAALAVGFWVFAKIGETIGLSFVAIEISDQMASLQMILLIFNMIPAFPLDGGRVFRALLWQRRGNLTSASQTASAVGQVFGGVMIGLGLLSAFVPGVISVLIPGFNISGIFLALVGFFIYSGAKEATVVSAPSGPHHEGPTVGDFTVRDFIIADPGMSVEELLKAFDKLQLRPTALVLKDGHPVGIIDKARAGSVPIEERAKKRVAEVMTPKEQIRAVNYSDPIEAAQNALKDGIDTAVVVNGDVVVGFVTVSDLARAQTANP